jgi:hypothetical protein
LQPEHPVEQQLIEGDGGRKPPEYTLLGKFRNASASSKQCPVQLGWRGIV